MLRLPSGIALDVVMVRLILSILVTMIAAAALFIVDVQYGWVPIPGVCDASDYWRDPATGKIVTGSDCPSGEEQR
jgi:hypothetical protein